MTFSRRSALATPALAAPWLISRRAQAASGAGLRPLATGLLADWCDALLRAQIDEPASPERHGAFRCPACGTRLHGRCGDAVYPLLHRARATGRTRYIRAAVAVVDWMKNVDAPDGAWTNDPQAPGSWKGITVFGAIALGEALHRHGELLDREVKERWMTRLRSAARFIHDTFKMDTGNINYPVTASYALTLLGELFDERAWKARGRQFAHDSLRYLTPGRLLYGEGQPQGRRSPKGLYPFDLGYNVEESLPALSLYALMTRDEEVLEAVTAALAAHLELMLPDGGWDNSFGTRNYKWTYWGSRTSDGCQTAYALLADRHPAFATAALRNTQLLRECTREGLLHGGPHYAAQGVPPCVHHTFCHAKALTTVLDHDPVRGPASASTALGPLPRESAPGARRFAELDTVLLAQGPWRATVSGYDWLYKPGITSGMGGALTMLWHKDLGPLCTASLATYRPVEPNNMQPLPGPDVCLTPRLETRIDGRWYSNIFDTGATISHQSDGGECLATARLCDASQKDPAGGPITCDLRYAFGEVVTVSAQLRGIPAGATVSLVLPVVSAPGEKVKRLSPARVSLARARGAVVVEASGPLASAERVFNLVPGFCAIPLTAVVGEDGRIECSIRASRHG
jgi:hypothetical protein